MFGRSKICIVCSEKLGDSNNYTHYNIRYGQGGNVGKLNVHKNISCHNQGAKILEQQMGGTKWKYVEVSTSVNRKKFVYYLLFLFKKKTFDFFIFWIYPNGLTKIHKDMYKFLKEFSHNKDLVFGMTTENLESNSLPILLCVNDPIIPSDIIQSDFYKNCIKDAAKKVNIDMAIRGKNKHEAIQILLQYVCSTTIRLD